jgi:hypothetical protein
VSTTRDLLDCLGRTTLVRLIRVRGVAPSRENEERRKTLAHSYRGDVEALIFDLSRQDLVTVFREAIFVVGGEDVYLANPAKYRLDELQAFGLRAFAGRRVRTVGEFQPIRPEDAEEEADEDEDESVDEAVEDDPPETDDDDPDPFGDLTRVWSRPRQIDRLLRLLGEEAPSRLRATRFRELLVRLRDAGVEACLADDASCTRLAPDNAESPGIAAKVRLRRTGTGAAATERRPPSTATEAGPPIVVQPGERPVSQRVPRPTDYKLAVLRLQFLTAVPTVERAAMPEWPSGYLDAATRGLQLRPEESRLLRALSTGLCLGNHSPYDAIPQLAPVMDPSEWQRLIDDFVALNPFQLDFVRLIVDQVAPVPPSPPTERGPWRPVEPTPTPEDFREPPQTKAPSVRPQAASGRGEASTGRTVEAATNVRDLGALANMFEDD